MLKTFNSPPPHSEKQMFIEVITSEHSQIILKLNKVNIKGMKQFTF